MGKVRRLIKCFLYGHSYGNVYKDGWTHRCGGKWVFRTP